MQRKKIALGILIVTMIVQISPVQMRAWMLGAAGLVPASISKGSAPKVPLMLADFDKDGTPEELSVKDGTATITSGGRTVWQSPETWQVVQAEIADLNHDGAPEATLLVWRPFHPWPVDQWLPYGGRIATFHDTSGKSCHIILIGWQEGLYREMWAGSALAEPVKSFAAADLNGDGLQELVTLEGKYSDSRAAPARALKAWEWNGFGFSVVSRIDGIFSKMALVHTSEGHILILVP